VVENLKKTFPKGETDVKAVRSVGFSVEAGEIFGIVGESGSGKSTVLRLIAGTEACDSGSVVFAGRDITRLSRRERRGIYREIQMVFQFPAASFDPRMTVRGALYEPLRNFRGLRSPKELDTAARELMTAVGLDAALLDRYAAELSGGQCQRAAIARAISVSPRLLLCDEVTSALDVSAQANIVSLLTALSAELRMSVLFVSHDIALVSNICRRCIVMCGGLVEAAGAVDEIIRAPRTAYTKRLVAAAGTAAPAFSPE
jgi:ABC-type glutathione transport system ATPase component